MSQGNTAGYEAEIKRINGEYEADITSLRDTYQTALQQPGADRDALTRELDAACRQRAQEHAALFDATYRSYHQ